MSTSLATRSAIVAGLLTFLSLGDATLAAVNPRIAHVIDGYVEAWDAFYPSGALSRGRLDAVYRWDDRSARAIEDWIAVNRQTVAQIEELQTLPAQTLESPGLTLDERIDLRLLHRQARGELLRWQEERLHETSLALYADLIEGAIDSVVDSSQLSASEKGWLLFERLGVIDDLLRAARRNLTNGRPAELRRSIETLERVAQRLTPPADSTAEYPVAPLVETARPWLPPRSLAKLSGDARVLAIEIRSLIGQLQSELLPRIDLPDDPILGREAYARRLAIYVDRDLTPEALAELALAEIEAAKQEILELSKIHWRERYPDDALPDDPRPILDRAFEDLERHRPVDEQSYLLELRRYREEVERFVRERPLATVPEHDTLSIELAPESSGPMARIGFVRSAPPFHPNPWTTWNLATIPDSHPEQERVDFWRSFNYHYKKFIVVHELYPGHYLQQKLLRENPHVVRILFPYDPFTEGWATFCEDVAFEYGYAEGDWLTRLAQARKRLENANRAYTSVQAHVFGWSEQKVFDFSVETSWLAPQFAKSLWGRLMRSPMQIITYMLGGLELTEIYEAEKARRGEEFVVKDFMDTVLRAGPLPADELGKLLAARP